MSRAGGAALAPDAVMKALYQVVTRSVAVRRGEAVFAGTRVPVRALMEHLDRGGDVEAFLTKYPSLKRDVALAAAALGLEALLSQVPLDPGPDQGSLLPRTDKQGAVVNAVELSAHQVVGKRVLCPACRSLVFRAWPEGWDSHAATRCRGLDRGHAEDRKAEFKRRYGYLFRGTSHGPRATREV